MTSSGLPGPVGPNLRTNPKLCRVQFRIHDLSSTDFSRTPVSSCFDTWPSPGKRWWVVVLSFSRRRRDWGIVSVHLVPTSIVSTRDPTGRPCSHKRERGVKETYFVRISLGLPSSWYSTFLGPRGLTDAPRRDGRGWLDGTWILYLFFLKGT